MADERLSAMPASANGARTPKSFEMESADRSVKGVTVLPDRLVIRPTLPARIGSVGAAVTGAVVSLLVLFGPPLLMVNGREPTFFKVLIFFQGLWMIAAGWRCAAARVEADRNGLTVRNHWRTRRAAWKDVRLVNTRKTHPRLGYLPYALMSSWVRHFEVGTLTLEDGSWFVMDAISSADTESSPPTARMKAAILGRWIRENGLARPESP